MADVQFSALGTVLLATLARLARSIGIDKDLKTVSRLNVREKHMPSFHQYPLENEDIGEALPRSGETLEAQTVHPISKDFRNNVSSKSSVASSLVMKESKKKKKQKKNVIDDLFEGLM